MGCGPKACADDEEAEREREEYARLSRIYVGMDRSGDAPAKVAQLERARDELILLRDALSMTRGQMHVFETALDRISGVLKE